MHLSILTLFFNSLNFCNSNYFICCDELRKLTHDQIWCFVTSLLYIYIYILFNVMLNFLGVILILGRSEILRDFMLSPKFCLVDDIISVRIEQMWAKMSVNMKKKKIEDIYMSWFQIASFPTQDNFQNKLTMLTVRAILNFSFSF